MSRISSQRRALFSLCLFIILVLWYKSFQLFKRPPIWDVTDFKAIESTNANKAPDYKDWEGRKKPEILAQQESVNSYDLRIPHARMQKKVQDYIQWNRPSTEHWPAWHDYDHENYDPNRWEAMERDYGFFFNDSVQELESRGIKPLPYLPYPDYTSEAYKREWHGNFRSCRDPRGEVYRKGDMTDFVVQAYRREPGNFPAEMLGSGKILGLDYNVCFDRLSRYAPYRSTDPKHHHKHNGKSQIGRSLKWENVRWGALQESCFDSNIARYYPESRVQTVLRPSKHMRQALGPVEYSAQIGPQGGSEMRYKSRTAVLIRTWDSYQYMENDIQAIRALVTEASLLSGGEYQIFLLVNIKQRNADIYDDSQVYQDLLKRSVPRELRDITILWTEKVCEEWYPHVGDWQVYWMQFMPVQWFSKQHPEYDYVWNWETDARYIGNHYHFFERVAEFAKNAPRKHLWERNARFFFPKRWGGEYATFLADTDEQILNSSADGLVDGPIWGPRPYAPFQYPIGPTPPWTQEEDNFEWGVGEEADLITLQPIWDPSETEWSYRNHIWNFIPQVRPTFTARNGNADGFDHPAFSTIPRRVFINTVARFSKRLLHAMHLENLQGRSMQAEMWPATVALQHGLKAVYAPHPVWSDRKWPSWYAEAVFNANDGIPARWGQQPDSPYNHDREANFGGFSWYYRSLFPKMLFRRWQGWETQDWRWDAAIAQNIERQELAKLSMRLDRDMREMEDLRMCLPSMLLHPVKNAYEGADGN